MKIFLFLDFAHHFLKKIVETKFKIIYEMFFYLML